MPGKIFVVYARTATGLKNWPIAAFFNSDSARQEAEAFAARAVREALPIHTAQGPTATTAKAEVRDFDSWGRVPSLSRGLRTGGGDHYAGPTVRACGVPLGSHTLDAATLLANILNESESVGRSWPSSVENCGAHMRGSGP